MKFNLQRVQLRMKNQTDKHRRDQEFPVGSWVFVKLRPYRQHSVEARPYLKLAKRYFGPFFITSRVGKVAYRLQLPPSAKIHNVFHVSVLKLCPQPDTTVPSPLPPTFDHGQPVFSPQRILKTRRIKVDHRWETQLLVHWLHTTSDNATWEKLHQFQLSFPQFHLGDKVNLLGDGIDIDNSSTTSRPKHTTKTPNKLKDYCM